MAITIVGPSGASRATQDLLNFLIDRRPKSKKFFLGQWLQKTDAETLLHLRDLVQRYSDNGFLPELDDLFSFIVCAIAAERGVKKVDLSDQILEDSADLLRELLSLENIRRLGWIKLHKPLSIEDPNVDIEVTDEGFKQGQMARPA